MEQTKDALSEAVLAKKLMPYTGHFAVQTVCLFVIALAVYLMSSLAGVIGWIPLWLTCIVNSICAYLLFTPLHEASHQNIKGRKKRYAWLENLIGWISALSLMAPYPVFKHLHLMHHGHTNDPEKDPDYWVASKNPFVVFLKCLTIYFMYLYHYRKDRIKLWNNPKTRLGLMKSILLFLAMNTLMVWCGVTFGWEYLFLIYVIPAFAANGFLAFAFDWLPHHPHAVQKKYLDTRIILKPGLSTILISQNMHLIHHLYSGIPYYNYGKAYKVLREKLEKEGANIES